jgi:hypothetical protein
MLARKKRNKMRDDLSDKLVHLTKGTGDDPCKHRAEALLTLGHIVNDGKLKGGTGFIKGGHKCVCFSEAPISKLSYIIAGEGQSAFKYQPYGVIVDKKWLFQKGGRPVIYGPDLDYDRLPGEMKYRHVRFSLSDSHSIDHTSEREWRIQTEELDITPEEVTLVVPDRKAKDTFIRKFGNSWHFVVLSDLGVNIKTL